MIRKIIKAEDIDEKIARARAGIRGNILRRNLIRSSLERA